MFKKLLPALLLSLMAATANATVVDYTMKIGNTYDAEGEFTGVDSNADGFLSLGELSAFSFVWAVGGYNVGLNQLSDFGRYDIGTNTWLSDASGWGRTDFAWFSFDNGGSSVNTTNTSNVVTVAQGATNVPEPAPVALLALGLLAIGAVRRRGK